MQYLRRFAKDVYLRGRIFGRALSAPCPGPAVIAGFFSDPRGVSQSARLSADALEQSGLSVLRHDISSLLKGSIPSPPPGTGGALLLHANPPEAEPLLRAWPTSSWVNRYRIGYWVWELPEAPKSWARQVPWFDELWTPSGYSAKALAGLPHAGARVRVMPHPVRPNLTAIAQRPRFGISPGEVAVLIAFDFRSTRARKNPDSGIATYLLAHPTPDGSARLIVKVLAPEADPEGMEKLLKLAAARSDITIVDEVLSDADMAALLASVDIVLSLHRAEGFGLMPAQAMAAGKPVVATGWSGVMEYLDDTSAALAPYRLVPVDDPSGLYAMPGQVWAEPDIEAAALLLASLIQDREWREALGKRGFSRIVTALSEAFTPKSISDSAMAWLKMA